MKRLLWKLFDIEHFDQIAAETRVPEVRFVRLLVRFGMWFYLVAIPILIVLNLLQPDPAAAIGLVFSIVAWPFLLRRVASNLVRMHQGKS